MPVNKYDFKRRFSINVYPLDETVSLCSEIIAELQQQVKVAAATPVFFTYQQTSCDALTPVWLVKDNIFNISCKKPGLDKTCTALLEYAKTAMFMWMFIEGLYLHNMITVTVFQADTYIKLYFYIGWTVPASLTAAWVSTMIVFKSSWGFYYFLPYYWILEGPRSTIIVVNLLFLINIIRVLVVKLRESRTSEIEQVRKAVRAAIFLLPLMGIANVFFWVDYRFTEAWKLALWSYSNYFLSSFQGFFVAILYCFLNGEVQTAVKNSFYLHMSLRNHDYTPCRNLTVVSTAPESEPSNEKDSSNWIRHCLNQIKKSPDDKDIKDAADNFARLSHDDTDTTIVGDLSSERMLDHTETTKYAFMNEAPLSKLQLKSQ
ncbi:hypothetical protein Zmor_013537 [Zophobas morio]|uniref:G-protein coupled receptors family 2 profile 2 domain-containing protein n=1 Tax=Zophobas morio TaxID=2755281 RepID=A0AA38IIR1_9CUCU|nr:hypothetical protein Zmor_013537 [Zophobas morio]